jgi:hypothetical protein
MDYEQDFPRPTMPPAVPKANQRLSEMLQRGGLREVICPVARGRWHVQTILRSMSRSKSILSTVQPLIIPSEHLTKPENYGVFIGESD